MNVTSSAGAELCQDGEDKRTNGLSPSVAPWHGTASRPALAATPSKHPHGAQGRHVSAPEVRAWAAAVLVALTTLALGCGPRGPAVRAARTTLTPLRCPSALQPVLPPNATSWLFARPRAIYTHPRLGPIVAHSFADASEQALLRRVERTGYDVRVLDRAAIAWTPIGTVYLASGPLDTARVTALLWEKLLNPRRRGRDRWSNERVEGLSGRRLAALLVVPRCRLAAYAEGRENRAVDRIVAPNTAHDPDELLIWHTTQVPDELARAEGSALVHSIRELELRARDRPDGIHVSLVLRGPLPADASDRVRRALDAMVESPIGELAGAVQWLTPDNLAVRTAVGSLEVESTIPWRALRAIADAMRGQLDDGRID